MPDLTFIIPIGPAHEAIAQRAIDSAKAQTMPCAILAGLDTEQRGPGVLRNAMLREVTTEFVCFLDADDWLEPTFAQETTAEYRRIGGNKYIFTDWIDAAGQLVGAPCVNGMDGYPISKPGAKPYCGGTWHVITTLIPTAWAQLVGGFDETLPAVEDTEFYLKLCTTLRCGHHLARPLFHYSPGGGRAALFHQGPDYQPVMKELSLRYGGRMGCCGNEDKVVLPVGERQPGDVLAMALWAGNRGEFGRVTGRHYPRISVPKTAWIDPRDAAQSPHLWRVIEQPATVEQTAGLNSLVQLAEASMVTVKRITPSPYTAPINEPPPPPVDAKPDVQRVVNLARRAAARIDQPIFVFPAKDYPSYYDIRRLVELSGFDAVTMKQIDVFSRRPLIVVSPEPIPDLNNQRARIICWQLEYAGDYASNYAGFTGELWASDKAWATAHGAKYVLLGSHPGLAGEHPGEADYLYDVTMLGYMTPRRQTIKGKLSGLRWPADYPGHGTPERNAMLWDTRLMLHVHQNDNAPYSAPQRLAIAAAHHLPVVSETVENAGDLADYVIYADYDKLPAAVNRALKSKRQDGEKLHQLLCVERTFRACVEEAVKS